jgi:cupin domain
MQTNLTARRQNMSAPRTKAAVTALASALTLAIVYSGCERTAADTATGAPIGGASFTLSSGSQSTLLGRATFGDPSDQTLKVKRISGDWHAEVKATPNLDIAVQRIVFQPGGQSGWHRHPGPVFIEVVTGTMTFYMSDDPTCTPMVRTAGQGYLDVGEHPHIARNESGAPAENIVVYLAPQAAALRIDAPDPGNCPF